MLGSGHGHEVEIEARALELPEVGIREVGPDPRGDPDPRSPDARAEGAVDDVAAALGRRRGAVGQDDIVDREVAEHPQRAAAGRQGGGRSHRVRRRESHGAVSSSPSGRCGCRIRCRSAAGDQRRSPTQRLRGSVLIAPLAARCPRIRDVRPLGDLPDQRVLIVFRMREASARGPYSGRLDRAEPMARPSRPILEGGPGCP